MSTRIYVLIFSGAGEQKLPQGRFFMVKSATQPLTIEARRRDGQPVMFENVGAGLQYSALESQKWTELVVTTALAQVVEIAISDDASVLFANTVTVANTVGNAEVPSTAIASPVRVTRATGGATTIAANAARKRITICNPADNATPGLLYLQAVGAGAGRGLPLDTGTSIEIKTTAAIDVRNDSGVSVDFTQLEET